jgi:WD40 repeat protein
VIIKYVYGTLGLTQVWEMRKVNKYTEGGKTETSNKATFITEKSKGSKRIAKNGSKTGKGKFDGDKSKTDGRTEANYTTKEPSKELIGHMKAVREIAYSEKHKILVSCGFDFEVFVWNPYYEKYIIKLEGHEHPLVGVNIPKNLPCFITCDTNGMIKIWNISDYSCLQTFYVSHVNEVT